MAQARHAALSLLTSLPARIAISVGLMAVVALSIDWDLLTERLAGAAWGWFVLSTALILAAFVVGAVRWHLLLQRSAVPASWRESGRAYAIGAFANNLLPSGFGGDAVRAWLVARSGPPLARALTSVITDRSLAFLCLIPVAWLGVAAAPGEIPGGLVGLLAAATAAAGLGGAAALAVLRRRGLGRLLPELLRPWATEVAGTLRSYGRDRVLITRVVGLGFVFQAMMVTAFWLLSVSLGLGLDLPLFAVILPLVLLPMVVPISIAGFGVREGAFVALLAEVGVPASDAVLLSLFTVAAVAVASLPGGLAMLVRHERPTFHDEVEAATGDLATLSRSVQGGGTVQ
jgi:glycosyltransferase 2 family protein